jgi:quinol monooxygenase YgiN
MTRKYVDCRDHPSVSGCTLAMSGEENELLAAATAHAVAVHGHTDGDELQAGVRRDLRDEPAADAAPGSFIQLIEFSTTHIDEINAMVGEWAAAIGADRAARWALTTADRDHPNSYVQIVQFADHDAAMRNSDHPATSRFAKRLQDLCDAPARFTNLQVDSATSF